MADKKPSIALDFDGVLHSYVSGWTGVNPTDPPVEGALDFVNWLVANKFVITIFSTRANSAVGRKLIRDYLVRHGFPVERIGTITSEKPNSDLYVDDRGFRFTGDFEVVRKFLTENNFSPKPWYK